MLMSGPPSLLEYCFKHILCVACLLHMLQISTPVCATLQQLIKSKEALTLGRQVAGLAEAEA